MPKNKLLQDALANVEKAVTQREMYDRLVKAGSKTIYSQKLFGQLAQHLRGSKDPVSDVAKGIVAVLKILSHRARGTIQQGPMLQAGMALVLDALDFLEQAGMLKIDNETLDRATQEYIEAALPSVGLSHEKMEAMLGEIKGVMADPAKMAAYQKSQGSAA